jgi:hypothetical protein
MTKPNSPSAESQEDATDLIARPEEEENQDPATSTAVEEISEV